MMRVCACSHSAQQGWQTSTAIFWPSSVGSGAYPSGARFCPQRGHLISSDIGFHLARIRQNLECGGKRSATPLWIVWSSAFRRSEDYNKKPPKGGTPNLRLRFSDRGNDVVILRPKKTERPHVTMTDNSVGVDNENR